MKTHKQYLAQVRIASFPNEWLNANLYSGGRKPYLLTLDKAKAAVEAMRNRYPGDQSMAVIDSRIRVREVTDWEELDNNPA